MLMFFIFFSLLSLHNFVITVREEAFEGRKEENESGAKEQKSQMMCSQFSYSFPTSTIHHCYPSAILGARNSPLSDNSSSTPAPVYGYRHTHKHSTTQLNFYSAVLFLFAIQNKEEDY